MIQKGTILKVVDNSGAKKAACIHLYKGYRKRYAKIGDIIKVAMIRLWKRLQNENLKSKMVLQVHDELVFDVFPGEEEILSVIVKEEMERVIELSVPLTVECQYGRNWLEAH